MRTGLFLLSGFLFLATTFIVGKLFSSNYPGGATVATVLFVAMWLVIAAFNMWVGVAKADIRRPRSRGHPGALEVPVRQA